MKKTIFILLSAAFVVCACAPLFAQKVEQVEKAEREIEKEKALREKIEEKKKPELEKPASPPAPAVKFPETKILIADIDVIGATLIPAGEINNIITAYKNKELSMAEMQKVADLITDVYRKKGLVTSRAYLVPQKIEAGRLEIRAIEGMTGDIEIKGNRYFKAKLIRNMIVLKKGEPFDYEILRKGLSKINEQPDRNAKAVIAPGKEPGTTDVVLEMKDNLPIHIGFDWDNFGSRYIGKDRYSLKFTHNNLLGFDDKLFFQYQLGQASRYFLKSIRYLMPAGANWELGISASLSRIKLGQELEDTDSRGKSQIYSFFANRALIDKENFALAMNLGFDYKDITNYQAQAVSSHDRIRLVKMGLDMDAADYLGRTIISNEFDVGLPNIMGGLDEQDSRSSRSGAGGKFIKDTINLLRLQKMPFSSTLLWKNQMQFSPYILTAAEQFQIGGISNNRGYPPAEVVGDRGYAMTWEWSIPPYFVPREIKFPFSGAKLYDALRLVTFYDWAYARLKRPLATEEKKKTLRSAGCGIRFNLPENFSLRVDFGWPLDNTPSDSDHMHMWMQVTKDF